mgnify:CR=1 FL=1
MIKNSNINERILYIIENQHNNNQKKFAESIGFAAQVIYNIVSGRKSKPSYDVIEAIISTNDDIDSEWLLTGKGSMLKNKLESDQLNFKELAEARAEIIDGLKYKISSLEKEILELKQQDQDKSKSTPPMATSTGK